MMDRFLLLAVGIFMYASVVVFFGGVVFRLMMWRKRSVHIGAPDTPAETGREITLTKWPGGNREGRFLAVALFAAALGLFLGHTRILGDVSFVISVFGEDLLNYVGNILGTALGLFFLAVIVYLLIRRIVAGWHKPAAVVGCLPLLLVLLIVLLGNYLRLAKPFNLEEYRAFALSLLALDSVFPHTIMASPAGWILVGHVFAASLLFIYIPFSGFIPAVCSLISRRLRRPNRG